jgi:hypothetical protein
VAVEYLEIADFLLIAEAVTGISAEHLANSERTVHLAGSALAAPAAAYAGQEMGGPERCRSTDQLGDVTA